MGNLLNKTGFLPVAGIFVLLFSIAHNNPTEKNELMSDADVLSLPLTGKKMVIAHNMTNIIRYKDHKMENSCDPDYFSPKGNISASLGGLTQVNVIADKYFSDKSLEEAVEFEMRTAIKNGIDGFQFYYVLNNDSWDNIIKAYIKVADEKNIDFKFTFCISHPSGGTELSRINDFGSRIKNILDETGRDNPHWLRTPDGRLILYTWYGDGLADVPEDLNRHTPQYYVAAAYKKLEDVAKEKFACVISINEQITREKLNNYLDYFPAVWLWTLPYNDKFIGHMVEKECKKRKRIFTGSAFPGFYTSKLLKKGTWDMYSKAADAAAAGIKNVDRKYIVTGLSYNFRKQLEFSLSKDVPLINIITWNDYPEGHHLAPEVNHNDGFGLLLNYYKSKWTNTATTLPGKDIVMLFYKKYKHTVNPSPFNIPLVQIEKPGIPITSEDSIEVVTILKVAGTVVCNGIEKQVAEGLQSTKFPSVAGRVAVALKRNNIITETVSSPEWITEQPYRTDRLTYCYTNLTSTYYKEILGEYPAIGFSEYNPTSVQNNISVYKQ